MVSSWVIGAGYVATTVGWALWFVATVGAGLDGTLPYAWGLLVVTLLLVAVVAADYRDRTEGST